ncbi:MAG: hypothetical protein EBQ87_04085 [Planctomycetes bacterium]|nr:hypothetical protein [Planctomycetota bacterium]
MRNLWLMVIFLFMVGCGYSGTGKPTLHPAKGKVSLGTGSPLAFGTLALEPAGVGAIRCQGKIGTDGTFELETGTEKGASAGKYKAYVTLPLNKSKGVPKKFQSDETSGIEVEIVTGDNDLDIKLK